MQAPSKKIKIFIAVAVLVVGAIATNKYWPSKADEEIVTPSYSTSTSTNAMPEGSIDGTAFLQSIATSSAATTTDDTPDTPSKAIAHQLFANLAYIDNSGSLDDASKQALVNNAVSQIQSSFVYKVYTANNLSYAADESADSVRFYASSFASLQVNMILQMQKRVGEIENNVSVLSDIYAKEAADLYALKVPRSIATDHLAIINNFSRAAAAMNAIAHEKDDPLEVPVAIQIYDDAQASQDSSLASIASFIKSNGIIFTSNDVGAYWNAFQ